MGGRVLSRRHDGKRDLGRMNESKWLVVFGLGITLLGLIGNLGTKYIAAHSKQPCAERAK